LNTARSHDVYSDEPWLSIRWENEHRCVHLEWKGFANSVEFRGGVMKALEAIRDKHAASMVSDTRRLEVIANEDQLWIRDTWVPLAVAAGLKCSAVVMAPRGLGRFTVEEVLRQVGDRAFVTRTFDSLADALKWVGGQKR
jgi:hypothetical protein